MAGEQRAAVGLFYLVRGSGRRDGEDRVVVRGRIRAVLRQGFSFRG